MTVKQRPILFSTEMVKALLAGNKTQTRRIVKEKIERVIVGADYAYADKLIPDYGFVDENYNEINPLDFCPYGEVGDILYVRETWAKVYLAYANEYLFIHKADPEWERAEEICEEWKGWNSSTYMPKKAARIWLEITDIRVERLQDISEQDAIAEGIQVIPVFNATTQQSEVRYRDYRKPEDHPKGRLLHGPQGSYFTLWDKINGDGQYLQNPWVWVITFEKVEKP